MLKLHIFFIGTLPTVLVVAYKHVLHMQVVGTWNLAIKKGGRNLEFKVKVFNSYPTATVKGQNLEGPRLF